MGSADPKVFGGFGTSINWKGLDASLSFNYRLGAKVYDYGAAFTGWGMREMTPLKDMALNSWTEDNPNANILVMFTMIQIIQQRLLLVSS